MTFYDEDEERDEEPRELPEVRLDQPGTCVTCGKEPECINGCFRCGRPVHYNSQDYLGESPCGGWILDSWHPAAPDENEFYCMMCLHAALLQEKAPLTSSSAGGLTFAYSDHKTLTITVDGKAHELSRDETRDLVAFLYDQRGELFFRDEDEQPQPIPVASTNASDQGSEDLLGDLKDHPF